MEANLIPCPDCGFPAEVQRGSYAGMNQVYSFVHCTNPSCHLYSHTLHFTAPAPEESDIKAAQSWNERYAEILPAENVAEITMRMPPAARPPSMNGLHA